MKLELLAPAGSPEALDAAIGEGADAVYLGLKDFNARLRSANFTYAQFESALRTLRRMGKKVYVTVNTVFEQREADRMYQFIKYLAAQQPDALIVQDFGVIEMVRSYFPSLRLHASTQMNIASARGANALSRHGVSRVVLARELSLEELKSIKSETNLELEVFVHGALCISVSGLCLFSSFLGGKSANRGMCTQACRRLYRKTGTEREVTASSDEENGYYFSPNDLQLLEHVPDLAAAGITALKIEGRMKSASYVGAVVSAYRLVVDAVLQGSGNSDEDQIRRSIEIGREILRNDFARPKTKYFFNKRNFTTEEHGAQSCTASSGVDETITNGVTHNQVIKDEKGATALAGAARPAKIQSDWLNPNQDGGTGISLGQIIKVKGNGDDRRALIYPPRGTVVSARDSVRIHRSDDSGRVSHKLTFAEPAGGSGTGSGWWISAPAGSVGDKVYLIQTKEKNKHYPRIITGNVTSKGPGRDKAPFQGAGVREKGPGETFPSGLYVAVSKPEDLYVVQSSRPQKVMLALSQKNAKYLASDNKSPLPFKKSEIILSLDPWFPQEIAKIEGGITTDMLEQLIEEGYTQYIVNNLGHFSLFRDYKNIKLIAGPWLYTFNSWALSFVSSFGVDGFISPLENNRQNLERTLNKEKLKNKKEERKKSKDINFLQSKFFITVFCYPPLFNIKADLNSVLNIKSFADNMGETFSLVTDREGSRVYPDNYFSIIDKIPFLKEAGFKRFIIDLSGAALKKSNYRDLMRAVNENTAAGQRPLPHSNRFNWKNGFYQ